ncbi:peptidase C1B, bleomycin hydrolase [Podospora fimiseda]|uniref:Cysteine proteinase 1, mitochondrial n=1 Tax=Podospora fimiseda TaxID=252190 RepID=A0AAN7BUL2_9PEZI|nr:peptidase C1B, bleomycin hydrolase [Podospora fimiseda]
MPHMPFEEEGVEKEKRDDGNIIMGGNQSSLVSSDKKKELFGEEREDGHDEEEEKKKELGGGKERVKHESKGIEVGRTGEWLNDLMGDAKNRLAITVLTQTNPLLILSSRSTKIKTGQHIFNITIPLQGNPITNQRSSGRCWLFAATNVFRVSLMQKYKLEKFEFSQSYLFFWDKLEKANWFLEQIISTSETKEKEDGRLLQWMLKEPLSDGGQWDMIYNLVEKYGLVPQSVYPDSWNAKGSKVLNGIIFTKLREDALILRGLIEQRQDVGKIKEGMLKEIFSILTLTLGVPPGVEEEFEWCFVEKGAKGVVKTVRSTPRKFAKESLFYGKGEEVLKHEYLTVLTVDRLGNVVGGREVTYVNVEMDMLKGACVDMLKNEVPVFFGCDVGKFSDRESGIMDVELVDYELGFNVSLLGMNKAQRLGTGESLMTHAMVLTGVHIDETSKKPVRWRVQNSWGDGVGEGGWFVMSDGWMDEFVYQAVIESRFLKKEVKEVLAKEEKKVLPLWDPMGSLA